MVVLAQDDARALGHDWIGTEHLLLGLLREKEGIAARILAGAGIELEDVRERVVEHVGRGESAAGAAGQIMFTPRAKSVLDGALREADGMNHPCLGTEHLLLGLVGEPEGVAAQILTALAAPPERIRADVLALLGSQ